MPKSRNRKIKRNTGEDWFNKIMTRRLQRLAVLKGRTFNGGLNLTTVQTLTVARRNGGHVLDGRRWREAKI